MRKLSLLLALMLTAFVAQAQDADDSMGNTMDNQSNYDNYNHWSIELQGGVTKPARPVASGYSTNTPDFWEADLGVRYMINEKFGLKANFGYNDFSDGDNSKTFDSHLMRGSLQGVINAGNILGFRDWTQTLNFLIHGGAGYARLDGDDFNDADQMGYFVAGVTPQIRLGNHFALSLDGSIFGNIRQDKTFDGNGETHKRGFNGYYLNGSIGLTYYIGGKNKPHADWFNEETQGNTHDKLSELSKDVKGIKEDMKDTDHDGVPDYLDEEPNTPGGLAVDSKGRSIDKNNNGIPDDLEDSLDKRYKKGSKGGGSNAAIEKLINDGYVNVYFKFDSTEPETYSLQSINYLIKYMNENTSAEADLVGYADEMGNSDYNKRLSKKRAERVKKILVASGVDEGRLTVKGNGEDNSVNKSSKDARQLVRRVTFKLK